MIIALDSTPGDVLKILSEMSWDTLFLLVGLAFVGVAVLGDIAGRISPGKQGRIAAGIIGVSLFACGFWYHSVIHGFTVTEVDVVPPLTTHGNCPLTVGLQGVVEAKGSGSVISYFEFSSGNASQARPTTFQGANSQIVPGVWQVQESLKDAWVRLQILAPNKMTSATSKPFSITCDESAQHGGAGAANTSTPPATTVAQRPTHILDASANSLAFDTVEPTAGAYLKRGQQVTFNIELSYNLVSADSAILSVSTAQFHDSPLRCGGSGELTDAVEIPIVHGKHQTQVHLTWSGDTGASTGGRTFGSGYLSFMPMFWASNNGVRGERINLFGTYSEYCYQFGR